MTTGMRKWMGKGCPDIPTTPAEVSIGREELRQLRDELAQYKNERDELRAKITEMGRQKPVEWQSRTRPVWNDGMWTQWSKCSEGYAKDIMKASLVNDWIYEARPLYTLPGAKGE